MSVLGLFGLSDTVTEEVQFESPFQEWTSIPSTGVVNDIIKDAGSINESASDSTDKNRNFLEAFVVLEDSFDADGTWCDTKVDSEGDLFVIFKPTIYVQVADGRLTEVPGTSVKIDDDGDLLVRVPLAALPEPDPDLFTSSIVKHEQPDSPSDSWFVGKYLFRPDTKWALNVSGVGWVDLSLPFSKEWKESFFCTFN